MKKHLLLAAACMFIPVAAQAGEIAQCGVPPDVHVDSPDFTYCDIYERQLVYKEKRDMLQEELENRQAAFAEPGKRAYQKYQENLQKLYDKEAKKAAGGNS